jgi:hypothetical protein
LWWAKEVDTTPKATVNRQTVAIPHVINGLFIIVLSLDVLDRSALVAFRTMAFRQDLGAILIAPVSYKFR